MIIMLGIGFFHAFLWLALLPIMKNWFSGKNNTIIMSAWMTSWNVGSLIAQRLSHFLILDSGFPWEMVFYVISAIAYILGLLCLLFLYTNPDIISKFKNLASVVPAD